MVQRFRYVLKQHNIGVDDKVALISNNRVEWAVAYYATLGMGAQIVPMYEAQMEKDWKFIVEDSDAKLLLVANDRIYERTKSLITPHSRLKAILSFDADPSFMRSYAFWMEAAAKQPELPMPHVPSDPSNHVAAIIYTSGTTGVPKGVELTHTNIVSNLAGLDVSNTRITVCPSLSANQFPSFLCLCAALVGRPEQADDIHGLLLALVTRIRTGEYTHPWILVRL